ncbi:hypothetical protein JYU34_008178 [Plutella xylostella]|uniref:SAM domain-containing protein n=1 Tax=Plutella xylostella TaxID=51655 RepID=A0ABQ7QNX9_PLUXY|nr:hypothetical protein JYU34_008178 [Plutella xylostella]
MVKDLVFPRRKPSVVPAPRKMIIITPDEYTCVDCSCWPKDEPYRMPKRLRPCQRSPRTLLELAAAVVDGLPFPDAFHWTVEDVARWMREDVGLPRYQECITVNKIDGRRLIRLEDPSVLPDMNIHDFEHMKMITAKVRALFGLDYIRFSRSIGLPPRKPLTHATWFKSRTGPWDGVRQTWTRSDVFRWMKIIVEKPEELDHWDLVWYVKPDFPKVLFGRYKAAKRESDIPHYKPTVDICREYLAPRKFRLNPEPPAQTIWLEHRSESMPFINVFQKALDDEKAKEKKKREPIKHSHLYPKKIQLKGLTGRALILARRQLPRRKFFL